MLVLKKKSEDPGKHTVDFSVMLFLSFFSFSREEFKVADNFWDFLTKFF